MCGLKGGLKEGEGWKDGRGAGEGGGGLRQHPPVSAREGECETEDKARRGGVGEASGIRANIGQRGESDRGDSWEGQGTGLA